MSNNKEAKRKAKNNSEWKAYFESIARYYVKAFHYNFEILHDWVEKLYEEKDNFETNYKNEIIYKEIVNYYQAYNALIPQSDGSIKINEKIMDKFEDFIDQAPTNELVISELKLKEYEIMNYKFTLDQLMNIMINFYKNEDVREKFFQKILSESSESINKMTRYDTIPLHEIKQKSYYQTFSL